MSPNFSDKTILVTGACGTIGRELVFQLLRDHSPRELVCIDNNESELFFLEHSAAALGNVHCFLADIRDPHKLSQLFKDVDIVFHTAAFKHVILCERSPFEAVQTNILGLKNIILAANENNVKRVIFTSSDKAVNPTNVMGTSKLMGERLITAANSTGRNGGPIFASTRFGNVLGSRGSVIPIFRDQIEKGGPVTVTDREMTRFIMSIGEAVRLVIDSAQLACGGEVFVTKMPTIRIEDLARVMIDMLAPQYGYAPEDIEVNIIGAKPGEKMYEELLSDEETRRTWELDRYFAVLPAFRAMYHDIDYDYPEVLATNVDKPYASASETPLTHKEIRRFLIEKKLLEEAVPASCKAPVLDGKGKEQG